MSLLHIGGKCIDIDYRLAGGYVLISNAAEVDFAVPHRINIYQIQARFDPIDLMLFVFPCLSLSAFRDRINIYQIHAVFDLIDLTCLSSLDCLLLWVIMK